MSDEGGLDLLERWRPRDGFLFEQRGLGVVGTGVAQRVEIPAGAEPAAVVQRSLDGVGVEGAAAVGALPFDLGEAAAQVVVPADLTVTAMRPRQVRLAGLPSRFPAPPAGVFATPLRWHAQPRSVEYAGMVAEATRLIAAGGLEKVVLSRSLVAANAGIDVGALLTALRRRDRDCHVYAAPLTDTDIFVGASPETLVRRQGESVVSLPLAGTAGRSEDPETDRVIARALIRSAKDLREHAPVVEAVADTLAPFCHELRVDPEPHLVATATVWHLATTVRGRLLASAPSALGLATLLHPTPAVCGTPREAAATLISRLESIPRGAYAGLVGWVDDRGDGEWAVGLRCALVGDESIRLFAGAGIVAGSDPEAEVAETDVKFRTLIDAVASALEAGSQSVEPAEVGRLGAH